jgi:hypothetical protein
MYYIILDKYSLKSISLFNKSKQLKKINFRNLFATFIKTVIFATRLRENGTMVW